jgi:hypothetical protein
MCIILAELSEQSAVSLSVAMITACVTVLLSLVVFVGNQYCAWRLERTKFLKEKLADLIASLLTVQEAMVSVPKASDADDMQMSRKISALSTAKVRCEAIQRVYFPEVSAQMSKVSEALVGVALSLLALDKSQKIATRAHLEAAEGESGSKSEALAQQAEELAGKVEVEVEQISLTTRIALQAGEELLQYLSADHDHLVRVPRLFAQQAKCSHAAFG